MVILLTRPADTAFCCFRSLGSASPDRTPQSHIVSPTSRLNNLTATGQWPDVNYTAGCDAQRANWPAQSHWLHSREWSLGSDSFSNTDARRPKVPLAAAYVDAIPHTVNITEVAPFDFIANQTVLEVLNNAMNWWYQNDFTNNDCIDLGGMPNGTCACGTPGMWNPNW